MIAPPLADDRAAPLAENPAAVDTLRYSLYRWNCGRDQRLEELWAGAGS